MLLTSPDIETLKIEDIDPEMEFEQKDLPVDTLVKDKDDNKERLKDDDIEEELDMIHQPDIGWYLAKDEAIYIYLFIYFLI